MKLSIKETKQGLWTIIATSKKGKQWEYNGIYNFKAHAIATSQRFIESGEHKKHQIKHNPNWTKCSPEYPPNIVGGKISVGGKVKEAFTTIEEINEHFGINFVHDPDSDDLFNDPQELLRHRCLVLIRALTDLFCSNYYNEGLSAYINALAIDINDFLNSSQIEKPETHNDR